MDIFDQEIATIIDYSSLASSSRLLQPPDHIAPEYDASFEVFAYSCTNGDHSHGQPSPSIIFDPL